LKDIGNGVKSSTHFNQLNQFKVDQGRAISDRDRAQTELRRASDDFDKEQ
jgi:hypothetical protein